MVRESSIGITIFIVEESWSAISRLRVGKLWNMDTKKTIGGLSQSGDRLLDGLTAVVGGNIPEARLGDRRTRCERALRLPLW